MVDSSAVSSDPATWRESGPCFSPEPRISQAAYPLVMMFTLSCYAGKAQSVTYLSDVITVNLDVSYPGPYCGNRTCGRGRGLDHPKGSTR